MTVTRTDGASSASSGDWPPRDLKAEHAVVFEAMRIATVAYERPVIVAEVIQGMSSAAQHALAQRYAGDFATAISKIVNLLVARGCVTTVGRLGRHRYYALRGALPAERMRLPKEKPRRQRVLAVLTDLVQARRTPARASDVVDAAATHAEGVGLTRTDVIRDLQNLVRTGDVAVVDIVRGGNDSNLYCPTPWVDVIATDVSTRAPLTWLELVRQTFTVLWTEAEHLAQLEGHRPFALETGAVRARLQLTHPKHERLDDPRVLINALQQLASTQTPAIRALGTVGETGTLRWVPASVKDTDVEVDGVYATDTERLIAAVRLASVRQPRARCDAPPPASAAQVAEVAQGDPSLRLRAYENVAEALADASKERLDIGSGGRADRVEQYIWRVGRIGGFAYYAVSRVEEARAYARLRNLESAWQGIDVAERTAGLDQCPLPATALGRARLLAAELSELRSNAQELVGVDGLGSVAGGSANGTARGTAYTTSGALRTDPGTQAGAKLLLGDAESALSQIREWMAAIEDRPDVPGDIDMRVPGWTAEEFHAATRALHPRGDIAKSRAEIIRLFPTIRRVENAEHEHRSRASARAAAENLFDRADALIHAAIRWGGPMAAVRASHARNLLDRLRDARYVLRDLEATASGERIGAVSSLAFLAPSSGVVDGLCTIAVSDPDPSVRQVALWALGLSMHVIGNTAGMEIVRARAQDDPDRRVRDAVSHALKVAATSQGWWAV